jgi:hypothetical protein
VSECEDPGEGLSRFLSGLLERVTAK